MSNLIKEVNWEKGGGLLPAIIQDAQTSRVLMLGYMNEEALAKTLKAKRVWFYSRARERLWMKGEESKNYLFLVDIKLDCDKDTLLVKVKSAGPTCHLLVESCFDSPQPEIHGLDAEKMDEVDIGLIAELYKIIEQRRKEMPEKSYTTELFSAGVHRIGAKVMEEAGEVYQAAIKETKQRLVEESVDIIYHLLTLLVYKEVGLEEVLRELKKRRGLPPRK